MLVIDNKLKRLGSENGKRIVSKPAILNQIYAEMAKNPGMQVDLFHYDALKTLNLRCSDENPLIIFCDNLHCSKNSYRRHTHKCLWPLLHIFASLQF